MIAIVDLPWPLGQRILGKSMACSVLLNALSARAALTPALKKGGEGEKLLVRSFRGQFSTMRYAVLNACPIQRLLLNYACYTPYRSYRAGSLSDDGLERFHSL